MSKTFSYVLLVIIVYLLIIFPKVVGKSNQSEEIEKRETTIKAGYTT